MPAKQPDGDMRRVKLREFSGSKPVYVSSDHKICFHCGRRNECEDPTGRSECSMFMPVLKFRSMKGMEEGFNTFRHGKKWSSMTYPGQVIALMVKGEIVGRAKVKEVHFGKKKVMEREHGRHNHLMMDQRFTLKAFERVRRRSSGNLFYTNATYASVIYLSRLI